MYAEVAWVLVSSGTQIQSQIILDPDHLPDYISVSYDYAQKIYIYIYIARNFKNLIGKRLFRDIYRNAKNIGTVKCYLV